jgi:hypothetical protein
MRVFNRTATTIMLATTYNRSLVTRKFAGSVGAEPIE